MAELLIRPGIQDAPALGRFLGDRSPNLSRLRVVVDAHVAARAPEVADTASHAGAPLLVDPQTYFLQDAQPHGDPWCNLPYGKPARAEPRDFEDSALDALIDAVVEFQVRRGATAIIPPYFYLGRSEVGWAAVQAAAWRRTRARLTALGVSRPMLAVICLDWNRLATPATLRAGGVIMGALRQLGPDEVALAGSKSHLGARPQERILDLCTSVVRLSSLAPVLAWQQGLLGEACVAAGAIGYETGIGHREALDIPSVLASRRTATRPGPRNARPVYAKALMRSIPKKSIQRLSEIPSLWPSIFCLDSDCCAPEGRTMLRDARAHSVRARRRSLAELTSVTRPDWTWGALADKAQVGLRLAERINRRGDVPTVPPTALVGMYDLASSLRRGSGVISVA